MQQEQQGRFAATAADLAGRPRAAKAAEDVVLAGAAAALDVRELPGRQPVVLGVRARHGRLVLARRLERDRHPGQVHVESRAGPCAARAARRHGRAPPRRRKRSRVIARRWCTPRSAVLAAAL